MKWLHREHKQSEIRTYLTGLVTGALFCLAVLLILQFVSGIPVLFSSSLTKEVAKKTQEAQSYIDKYYWKSDLDQEKLADYAIKGMVSALGDKYSDYYTTSEYNQAMGEVKGDYTGIGAYHLHGHQHEAKDHPEGAGIFSGRGSGTESG